MYKIKSIISAERACEVCGNTNLERNVILVNENGDLLYVGSDCAGKLVHGRKTASHTKRVVKVAEVMKRAAELLAKGQSIQDVESYVWTRLGDATYCYQVREMV